MPQPLASSRVAAAEPNSHAISDLATKMLLWVSRQEVCVPRITVEKEASTGAASMLRLGSLPLAVSPGGTLAQANTLD